MTVKYSFLKLMKEDLKRRVWVVVLCFYLFLMQVLTYIMQQPVRGEVRGLYLGPENTAYFQISIIIALICGLQGYSYLFAKKKTDFYFSLPIKKSSLFSAAYLNGLLIFLIPCAVSRLICYGIGTACGYVVREGAFACTLMGIIVSVLGYLLLYHIFILGAMLAGNLMIALAASGILLFYGKIIIEGVLQTYSRTFFHSFYQSEILYRVSEYLAPLTLYNNLAGMGQYRDVGEWSIVAQMKYLPAVVAAAAITLFVSYWLYQRRPAEAAGRAIAFEKSQSIIRFLLVIPLALLTGYFFMLCSGGFSFPWVLTGVLVGCVTFHGMLEVIFQFNIRGMISYRKQLLVTGIACGCIVGIFYFNAGEYDSYIPEIGRVDSMAVSISGVDDGRTGQERGIVANTDLMVENRLNQMNLTGENMMNAHNWVGDIVTAGVSGEADYLTYATVAYRLKNGKSEYRRYGIQSQSQLESFDLVYSSIEYKEGIFPIITTQNAQEIIWSNGIETYTVDWELGEKETLLRLYREELGALSMYDVKRDYPIGTLTAEAGKTGYLYPTFTKTIAYLKERGIKADKSIGDYDIKWIVAIHNKEAEKTLYNRKNKVMEVEWMKAYKDEKAIEAIKPKLVPSAYAINPLLHPLDTAYELTVKYKDSEGRTAAKTACHVADGAVFQEIELE